MASLAPDQVTEKLMALSNLAPAGTVPLPIFALRPSAQQVLTTAQSAVRDRVNAAAQAIARADAEDAAQVLTRARRIQSQFLESTATRFTML